MLKLTGQSARFCDGISRRSFVQAGFLGLGGLTLGNVLRLQAASSQPKPTDKTSVIFVELAGGPTQFETYDPKPNAPVEYRGPFSAIQTNLPGEYFCELLPEQAQMLDKLTIIRSIHHSKSSHDPSSHLSQTGYYKTGPKGGPAQMPSFGSVIAKQRGANAKGLPGYVAVPTVMRNGHSAFLGGGFAPFETNGDPNGKKFEIPNLSLTQGIDIKRIGDRRSLLDQLDAQRRMHDLQGTDKAIDQFSDQAFELVAGSRARIAFDIQKESQKSRDAYGRNTVGQSMLLARRLIEHGVTCVTVRVTGWDDHGGIPKKLPPRATNYDRGIAALINDLYDRGLQENVLVVAMGEFGRTPRVNPGAGRGHWGPLMSVLMAGGGLNPGILGASTPKGEVPIRNAYRPENVLAMLYRHMGIDPSMTFNDFTGRPRYVLEERELIKELI